MNWIGLVRQSFGKSRHLSLIAILIALSSCATNPVNTQLPAEQTGTLIVALGFDSGNWRGDSDFTLDVRNRNSKETLKVKYQPRAVLGIGPSTYDFNDAVGWGLVQVINLPPGEYEIHNFLLREELRFVQANKDFEFAIPFSIRKDQSTYIGEYLAHKHIDKNKRRLPITDGAYIVVANRFDRDMKFAKARSARVQTHEVAMNVPDVSLLAHPLVRSSPMSVQQ